MCMCAFTVQSQTNHSPPHQQLFVAAMDYESLRTNGGAVSFTLDGKSLTLQQGKHYFFSATERVRALNLPEMAFLSLQEDGGNCGQ